MDRHDTTRKLGLVITDGVGFRNYILSGFVAQAERCFEEVIIYSFLPASAYDTLELKCRIVELDLVPERFPGWFFRKAKEVAHLKRHARANFGFRDSLYINRAQGNSPRAWATRFIFRMSGLFHGEQTIGFYERQQQRRFASHPLVRHYEEMLRGDAVDLLFFTHQRPPFAAPLLYAARQAGIPTAAFIFSWDNLASKGRMAGAFDHFLVWSDLMRRDLLEFYPAVTDSQIAVVGTPQFEPFVMERYGYDDATLAARFGIDLSKPLVLFTCNDASSKNDPLYLDILAGAIAQGRLHRKINLVARTSPAEDPGRFAHLREKYPFIIWNYPEWTLSREGHPEPWSQRIPSQQDISDLKMLLKHAAFTVNVMSTITIDSFLFDKPVVNPVFGTFTNGMYPDQKYLLYRHLEPLTESGASHIVRNETEFIEAVNGLLAGHDGRSERRRAFVDLQIGAPLEGTCARIAQTLRRWTR